MATLRRLLRCLHPWVAMAAAQALGLHMLLVAVAAGQVIAGQPDSSPFVICYGDHSVPAPADDDTKAPGTVHHAPCVLCSVAMAAGAITPAAAYLPFPRAAATSYEPTRAVAAVSPHRTPRSSQGPPSNA